MPKKLFAFAALFALANPVFAGHCPADVKAIDAAVEAGTDLDEETLAKVKELRDQGEALHNDGKHADSLDTLHEAMKLLGVEHQ